MKCPFTAGAAIKYCERVIYLQKKIPLSQVSFILPCTLTYAEVQTLPNTGVLKAVVDERLTHATCKKQNLCAAVI